MSVIDESGAFNDSIKIYAKTLSKNSLQRFLIPLENHYKTQKEKELQENTKHKHQPSTNKSRIQEGESATTATAQTTTVAFPNLNQTKVKPNHQLSMLFNKKQNQLTSPNSQQILTDRVSSSRGEIQLESILTSRSKDANERKKSDAIFLKKEQKVRKNISCADIQNQNISDINANPYKINTVKFHLATNKNQKQSIPLNPNHLKAYLTSLILPNSTQNKNSTQLQLAHFKSQSVQWQ